MLVSAYFSESGTPKTGLSPLVEIREVESDTIIVAAGAMVATVSDGFYDFDFTAALGYYADKNYTYICDSVTLTGRERYSVGEIICTDAQKILLAVFAAKRTGMGTANTLFRNQADTKNAVDATLDSKGNITAITLDLA